MPGIFEDYMPLSMPVLLMALEAENLGCASCILCVKESEAFRVLKLEKGDICPLVLAVGYPVKNEQKKARERKELYDLVSYEYSGGKPKTLPE